MSYRITIILPFLLLTLGCSENKPDNRLTRIAETISESPQKALSSLDSINYESLTDADKQYFDFLTIKSKDKAFIHHTSDSLILRVIEREDKNSNIERYAETLYYGGRVYHDLGDLPTALNYYQNALDLLSKEGDNSSLRGSILSQISGLLNSLRLYEQAIPYAEEVLSLDSIRKDSMNLMYDTELLGSIYLHAKNYESAEKYFNKSKEIAKESASIDTTRHNLYLAAIKYNKGQINSALELIRPTMLNIDSISRNIALAYACDIYRKASIPDTALMYAYELIHSKNSHNRKTGYQILLSDDLKNYIPTDSIIRYACDYRDIVESYLNQNGNQAALIQNSFYNYQLHQREKLKAEAANKRLFNWLGGFLLAILILSIYVLYLKNKNKSQLIQLHEAINLVNTLQRELHITKDNCDDTSGSVQISNPESNISKDDHSPNIQDLRVRLREELLSIRYMGNQSYSVSPIILESEAYEKILEYIKKDRIIPDKNPIWVELEEAVLKSSPQFKHRLHLLTGGKLKPSDFHLALLIKCGISSTNISTLVGRAKSTVAYRKDALGFKVFDQKLGTGVIDDIIRLL